MSEKYTVVRRFATPISALIAASSSGVDPFHQFAFSLVFLYFLDWVIRKSGCGGDAALKQGVEG